MLPFQLRQIAPKEQVTSYFVANTLTDACARERKRGREREREREIEGECNENAMSLDLSSTAFGCLCVMS